MGKEGRDLDFAFKQGILKGKEKSVKESEPGTLNPDAPEFTIHELPRATPGSAGLDLASSKDMFLSKWDGISLVPTSMKGTLLPQTVGLIGRSYNYQKNFKVVSGVIDEDIENDIKVMMKPLSETIQIHKGQRIAQLLLLLYVNLPNKVLRNK